MKTKVMLVGTDDGDWDALYINGELKEQNHSLSLRDVLAHLQEHVPFELVDIEAPQKYVEEQGMPAEMTSKWLLNMYAYKSEEEE